MMIIGSTNIISKIIQCDTENEQCFLFVYGKHGPKNCPFILELTFSNQDLKYQSAAHVFVSLADEHEFIALV